MAKRRDEIVEAIRLVWDSLDSHLDDAITSTLENECCRKAVGTPKFHRKCVKEYAFIIRVLTDQL